MSHLKEAISSCIHVKTLLSSPFRWRLLASSLPRVPADAAAIRSREKQSLLLSAGAGRRLSVPSALFDDSISNSTLILAAHCLFFVSVMKRSWRGVQQGKSLKLGSENQEPRSSQETARDNFSTHQHKEHDGGAEQE